LMGGVMAAAARASGVQQIPGTIPGVGETPGTQSVQSLESAIRTTALSAETQRQQLIDATMGIGSRTPIDRINEVLI